MIKRLLFIALILSSVAGCRVVKVKKCATGGWEVYQLSHWLDTKADKMEAAISPDGTVRFSMNGLKSETSDELAKAVKEAADAITNFAKLAGLVTGTGSTAGAALTNN